ncbi:MAG: DUF4058 family protein [Planctomycetes bacterium]|nr:DUF4058 family protein [Planctomycetota bacterium]
MPLLDHFYLPIKEELPWSSLNTLWTSEIVGALNHSLPRDRYRAFANRFLGKDVAADIAEFELTSDPNSHTPSTNGAVALENYTVAAMQTMPALFPDDIEIHVTDATNRRRLVAVMDLVSPANKKETSERDAFTAKCAAYLQKGIGLVIVDIVTENKWNLHDELIQQCGQNATYCFEPATHIYVTSYRPVQRGKRSQIDLWKWPLQIGDVLPTVPLPLKGGPLHPLDLEATYLAALDKGGISA